MAIETHVHDGTAYRKLKSWYAHDGSAWRDLYEVYCHDGTDWRLVFSKGRWIKLGMPNYPYHITEIGGTIYAAFGASGVNGGVHYWTGSTWVKLGTLDTARYVTEIGGTIYAAFADFSGGVYYWTIPAS